jgi:hypothetical protein
LALDRVPPAVSVASVGREIELRRHTDADDDVLTAEGVRAALAIGARLRGDYDLAVSTVRRRPLAFGVPGRAERGASGITRS